MAAQMASLPRIPVVIRRHTTTPEKLSISVIENIQRQDLTAMEEARAYDRLNKQFGMSTYEIAKQVGRSQGLVANAVRMLKLPPDMIKAIEGKKIPHTHSRYLLMLSNYPDKQQKLFSEMLKRGLDSNVSQERVWELQKEEGALKGGHTNVARSDSELDELTEKIKDAIGIPGVKMNHLGRRTRIFIEFPSRKQMLDWVNKKILT